MERMIHLFLVGGFVMWPLLLASVVVIAIAIERSVFYRRSKSDLALLRDNLGSLLKRRAWNETKILLDKVGGSVSDVLGDAVSQREFVTDMSEYLSGTCSQTADRLKAQLNYLSAIVTLAPLMGLLGTVIGMIRSFDVLSVSEGEPFAITGGVAEALVATGFGLFVAILALIVHVWLSQWANRCIADVETGANLFLTGLPAKE